MQTKDGHSRCLSGDTSFSCHQRAYYVRTTLQVLMYLGQFVRLNIAAYFTGYADAARALANPVAHRVLLTQSHFALA